MNPSTVIKNQVANEVVESKDLRFESLRKLGKLFSVVLAEVAAFVAAPAKAQDGPFDASNLYLTGGNYNTLLDPQAPPHSDAGNLYYPGMLGVDYDFDLDLSPYSMPNWNDWNADQDFTMPEINPYDDLLTLPKIDLSQNSFLDNMTELRLPRLATPDTSLFDMVGSGYEHHNRRTTPWGTQPGVSEALKSKGLVLPELGSGIGPMKRDSYSFEFTPPPGFDSEKFLNSLAQSVSRTVKDDTFTLLGKFEREASSDAPIRVGEVINIDAFGGIDSMKVMIVDKSSSHFTVHTLKGHVLTGVRDFYLNDLGNGRLELRTSGDSQPSDLALVPEWMESLGGRLQAPVWKHMISGAKRELTRMGAEVHEESTKLGWEYNSVPIP